MNNVQNPPGSTLRNQSRRPPQRWRIPLTGALALLAAGASAWLTLGSAAIHCDSLAPLTVLATLSAFIISICFRQMGKFTDKRSRWLLFVFLLVAAGTLFGDFRYVRRYRDFCDQLRQQIPQPSAPNP